MKRKMEIYFLFRTKKKKEQRNDRLVIRNDLFSQSSQSVGIHGCCDLCRIF